MEPRRLMATNAYIEQDLVSDSISIPAARHDARLVNAWGIVTHGHGIEVAAADSGLTMGFDASGTAVGAIASVPAHAGAQGHPTGIVVNNDATKFLFTGASGQVSANFIYVTEDGTIDAWNTANRNRTLKVVVDHSPTAIYKGLALGLFKKQPFLYAANFKSGHVEVFNASFKPVKLPGTFADPNLPAHFAPFNIQAVGGQLFVSYAKQSGLVGQQAAGAGTGLIDVFSTDGKFVKRFTSGGTLNAPWGMAVAPSNFAAFSNDILVGNFGDGKINAFNATTGKLHGTVSDFLGHPLVIDGLWGLAFGNGKGGTIKNGLYFTAGPEHEAEGLYGRVLVDPNYASASIQPGAAVMPSMPSVDRAKQDPIDVDELLTAV
ncbi:MAG TPA: TIGR03118 family protein [Tepidisphaeraceae bacterium]